MTNKQTNNDIKRSSIKSIIFSGLLAFSFMGIDNAFCANNANKAIHKLLSHYHRLYSSSLVKNLKAHIATILNTKIEGESLFDLLVRYQNNHRYLCYQNKDKMIKSVFADTKYDVHCFIIGRIITFTPKNKSFDDLQFWICSKSITDEPNMANTVSISIYSPRVEGDRVNVLDCVVTKQKNDEYKLEISI